MGLELLNWFFLFSILALFTLYRSNKRLQERPKEELCALLSKKSFFSCDLKILKEKLLHKGYKLYFEEETKLIVESTNIGFFHWGFLYILTCKEDGLEVGIFPKGPNPPKRAALEKYLDEFISNLEKLLE